MASLVGFMFLNRQNIVADRDVQTPMGQMEYTHGHQSQSVVRGGKIVLLSKLAVESAQIVYTDLTFFKIRIGGKGKVERSAICYLLMQRTVKFVAVEKLNMRAVFAVSVGDEKKLARVFGAANERRWTRSDYAEGKQGEELYMSNNQN